MVSKRNTTRRIACLFVGAVVAIAASSAHAVTVLGTVASLGTPSETRNSTGTFATYENRTVGGVTTVDVKDATFRLLVDFNDFGGATANQVLWETGGGTVGFSLVYSAGNTLTLRHASNGGNTVNVISSALSASDVAGGDVELVWTFDASNSAGTPEIALWVNEMLVGTATSVLSNPDWSGANGAGFGVANGGVAANGGNQNLSNAGAFDPLSGTINTTVGLQFWADKQLVFIPEPATATLGLLAFGGLMLRRRRAA